MNSNTWKQFERDAAEFLGGKRYPANQGGPIDIEGPHALGQCKKKKALSHQELAREVVKMSKLGDEKGKMGCVVHQVPRQKDCPSVKMITMSWDMFDEWFSMREKCPEIMGDPWAYEAEMNENEHP